MLVELVNILEINNIKYEYGDYAGKKSIVIKKNKHKIEIYESKDRLVSDLQRVPYTWGRMGRTTLEDILEDLRDYLKIDIKFIQTSIFDLGE